VPLDHDDPAGDAIDIAVAVYPVQSAEGAADPAPDPLFFLAGGPGQKAIAKPPIIKAATSALAEREIVVIDQRGVGESRPALDCPELDKLEADPAADDKDILAATEKCRADLSSETDLSAYGTAANAADIDLVRQALGYDEINLMGTSYGSHVAIEYARDHSDTLRSLVLNSPVPADSNYQADIPKNVDEALSALIEACTSDAACAKDNPDLEASVEKALELADQNKPEVKVKDASGKDLTVVVDAKALTNALVQVQYVGPFLGGVPQAITAAGKGDYVPLVQAAALTEQPGGSSQGMQLSTLCSEEVARLDIDQVREDAKTSPYATALVEASLTSVVESCELWDVDEASPEDREPVSSEVPALVVTGAYDPVTPTSYGESVAEDFSAATLVEFAATAHDPLGSPPDEKCGAEILAAFLSAPDAEVDAACAGAGKLTFAPMEELLRAAAEQQGGG
jgi:pimeloyl-ACP methyl ester carboxylesterase